MKKARENVSLKTRVPVSTTGDPCPGLESHARPVGLNPLHEARLITQLVDHYGWTLCADGNLYNPYPSASQMRGDAA